MTERLIISHLQLNSWSESVKHEIIISWDHTIGAITVPGQLRTVRFVVGKKNYLETNTSNTKFSPPWFCPWSHTYKGTLRGHCHPNSSTMVTTRGKSLPTGLTECLFLGVVNWNQCHGHSCHQRRQHDSASLTLNMLCVTCWPHWPWALAISQQ